MNEKTCLECHSPIKGRADKRFCDDACRNAYNNRLNSDQNNYVRTINNALRKNRRVLSNFLGDEKMVKIRKDKLIAEGLKLEYHTHHLHTAKGHIYVFCYEYGYLPLENDIFLVVKDKGGAPS